MDHLLVSRLYWKLLETQNAQTTAEEGLRIASERGDLKVWAPLAFFLLRIYQETFQIEKAEALLVLLKERQTSPEVRSGLNYILGIQATQRQDFEEAARLFEIAEVTALHREDEFRGAYGLAMVSSLRGHHEWDNAVALFEALEARLSVHPDPDIEFNVQIMKARALCELSKEDAALSVIEHAKRIANLHLGLHGQVQIAITEAFFYLRQNRLAEAHACWVFIRRLAPAGKPTVLDGRIQALKKNLQLDNQRSELHLVTDGVRVLLRNEGREVEVTKLPQLVNLLKYLGENLGRVFSKEELCEKIWSESYHPLQHDNKIYVTIRRLRSLLSQVDAAGVILSRNDGYTYNPQFFFKEEKVASLGVPTNSNKRKTQALRELSSEAP